MRVVVPYVDLHPRAAAALERCAPDAERVYVGVHTEAYWRLVADLWAIGETFAIIEHDIEIHNWVLSAFTYCPEPWCTFIYRGAGDPTDISNWPRASLGCARFRSELMAEVPSAVERAGSTDQAGRDWRRLDVALASQLEQAGFRRCVHGPAVAHHHRYPGFGCACGEDHGP